MTLDQALEIYAQPKYGAGRRASSALAEFEADPVSGKPIRIRDGRFGAYVTDGETNVTISRGGQTVEDITFEVAVQMLADKRAKGPATKRGAKKAPAKKPAAKKAPATKKPAARSLPPRRRPRRRPRLPRPLPGRLLRRRQQHTRAANAAAKAAEKADS